MIFRTKVTVSTKHGNHEGGNLPAVSHFDECFSDSQGASPKVLSLRFQSLCLESLQQLILKVGGGFSLLGGVGVWGERQEGRGGDLNVPYLLITGLCQSTQGGLLL